MSTITFSTFGDFTGIAAPAVSAAGHGRVYFDSTTNTFRVSQNGRAYADMTAATLFWGNGGITNTTTTRFLTPGFESTNATVTVISFRIPYDGTLRNLRVHVGTPGTSANLVVYTVLINGVATALSVSMASTAADGSDLANVVTVAAGDLIDIRVTKAVAITGAPADVMTTIELAAG